MENIKIKNILLLYVEDDENIRDVFVRFLERKVENVLVAVNGKEGYEKFLEHKPDLIITDIKMPIMSGLEMSKKIRLENDKIPIIVTTAHTEAEFFQEAISIGVNTFLLKPVDMNKLQSSIVDISDNLILRIKNQEAERIINEQDKMIALADLISNIAHQWRQPLAAISAASFNMQFQIDSGKYDKKLFRRGLESISECIQYLSDTIDSFKHIVNDDRKKVQFDIIDKIKEALCIESGIISSKNIKLVTQMDEKIIISGYPNEFIQALINIINNSLDIFEKSEDIKKYIFIETKVDENTVKIILKDSGGGIPDNLIDSIFEPYTTSKHKSKGIGLGLYMAYRVIVQNMSGTISAQNCSYEYKEEEYAGACIEINLKISSPS